MQHQINQPDQIRNGRLSAINYLEVFYARYFVNRARWLDHYCITKCEVSVENVS